jgi:small neutral amino acid transporter SnatA (MarC family)
MSALLWRLIIAVICCVLIFALMPPFFRIVGFQASEDVQTILRICIGGLAVLYVVKGPPPNFG